MALLQRQQGIYVEQIKVIDLVTDSVLAQGVWKLYAVRPETRVLESEFLGSM